MSCVPRQYKEGWHHQPADRLRSGQPQKTSGKKGDLCAALEGHSSHMAIRLLTKIKASNQTKCFLYVILGKAADHKEQTVRSLFASLVRKICLIPLSPYCQHLNPVERFRANMHCHVTHKRDHHAPKPKQVGDARLAFSCPPIRKNGKTFRTLTTPSRPASTSAYMKISVLPHNRAMWKMLSPFSC